MTVLLLTWSLHTSLVSTAFASGGGPVTLSATVNLEHSPTGKAYLFLDDATRRLTVTIHLLGLAPHSTHPAHIYLDTWADPQAEQKAYKLTDVAADAMGQGTSVTVLHAIDAIPASGWSIEVQNGPGVMAPDEHARIARAVIVNPDGATRLRVLFGPTDDPNEHAVGTATLTLVNGVLTVSIDVHGLAPYSAHAAHIHAGNCASTTGVVYDLSPLVANAHGHARKVVTFTGVSTIPLTDWDINVHYSTDLSTQTGYNPLLCGDVVPD